MAKKRKAPKSTSTAPPPAKKERPTRGKKKEEEKKEEEVDLSKMTVAQLKKECDKQGLDASGRKADLISRLQGDEPEEEPEVKAPKLTRENTLQKAAKAIVASGSGKKLTFKPDKECPLPADCKVYEDYDCMLNKTDIGKNNNKYYLIQVLSAGGSFYAWNRWGRIGNTNGQKLHGPFKNVEDAIKSFQSKFWDKTRTSWQDRASYKPTKDKYTLIEMGEEEEEEAKICFADGSLAVTARCTLDENTQALVKFVFDTDMFKKAMIQLSFDVKKMPLGKLSKVQIAKGFDVLDRLREAMEKGQRNKLNELSSAFYTMVPHDFGWKRPPAITTQEEVREKMDNLLVLGDIELAQNLQKSSDVAQEIQKGELPPHPLDVNYKLLQCDLECLDQNSADFKTIKKYLESTKGGQVKALKNVWQIDRRPEKERFKQFEKLGNRRLLWHGTNVAVVAAILKEGLRIMPHSGGRVGKGLYFASENSKSAAYTRAVDKKSIMFLNEVALGKEKIITVDDSSITKAPAGFDSVVAKGRVEPDPKAETCLTLEGKQVIVPQGKPLVQNQYKESRFHQSEYLIYSEAQARMRYLLQLEWTW